jgi:hypothetical protein
LISSTERSFQTPTSWSPQARDDAAMIEGSSGWWMSVVGKPFNELHARYIQQMRWRICLSVFLVQTWKSINVGHHEGGL